MGESFDNTGSSLHCFRHRTTMADKTYYKPRTKLHGKSPIGPRLEAWTTCPLASVLYGSKHWRVNQELLTEVQTWELGKLRRIFVLKAPSKVSYYWHTTKKLRTLYKHLSLIHI